ncbi:MAG: hypothetical protein JSU90_12840 [Nitrospiraceae bacterium]|nr:MAG: hypothetical protein JSU90_12840 [Nitrospiraceae bacterium]
MGYKALAEAVILQSAEDLWDPRYARESREFFEGEGFALFARIAGIHNNKNINGAHTAGGRPHDRTDGLPGA